MSFFGCMGGRYHGNYRNDKEHANLKGFSGIDPPRVPARIRKKAHDWRQAVGECENLIAQHQERIAQLKRMVKVFIKAQQEEFPYPEQ